MDRLLNVLEVSRILAMDEIAICDLYKEYRIPGVFKFEGHLVIAESDLEKWIDAQRDPQKDYARRLELLKRAGYPDPYDPDIVAYAEKKNQEESKPFAPNLK